VANDRRLAIPAESNFTSRRNQRPYSPRASPIHRAKLHRIAPRPKAAKNSACRAHCKSPKRALRPCRATTSLGTASANAQPHNLHIITTIKPSISRPEASRPRISGGHSGSVSAPSRVALQLSAFAGYHGLGDVTLNRSAALLLYTACFSGNLRTTIGPVVHSENTSPLHIRFRRLARGGSCNSLRANPTHVPAPIIPVSHCDVP